MTALLKKRAAARYLYTSAYAQNATVHHGRLDPGAHLISRPFTYADFATQMRALMDGNED